MRIAQTRLLLPVILLMVGRALATPKPGDLFPVLTAKDLTGETHRTDEFVGKRTLVVAISDRNAADAMRAWYAAADSNIPATVARRSIISLHLPFFVTTDYARSRAREQVPPAYWPTRCSTEATWLSISHNPKVAHPMCTHSTSIVTFSPRFIAPCSRPSRS